MVGWDVCSAEMSHLRVASAAAWGSAVGERWGRRWEGGAEQRAVGKLWGAEKMRWAQ